MRITERELREIELALLYEQQFRHGTAGHTQYMLIAKLAKQLGFRIDAVPSLVATIPDDVETIPTPV